MAIQNISVIIAPPAKDALSPKVAFVTSAAANDLVRIPRRVPFVDITAPNDFFRHGIKQNVAWNANLVSKGVSTDEFPGSAVTDTEGGLGYQLPHPEKLVLLVKKGAAGSEAFTILGSTEYRIDDLEITVPSGAVGDLYEFSLTNFGLYIGGSGGEAGLVIKNSTTTLGLALLVRAA